MIAAAHVILEDGSRSLLAPLGELPKPGDTVTTEDGRVVVVRSVELDVQQPNPDQPDWVVITAEPAG